MTADNLVSVVAPIHDDGPDLEAFVVEVSAVLQAHWSHYEIVLVDDHSADDTVLVAEHLLARYPCLRLIRLARRYGAEVTIAAGLDAAIGDFVVVMRAGPTPPARSRRWSGPRRRARKGACSGRPSGRGPAGRSVRPA